MTRDDPPPTPALTAFHEQRPDWSAVPEAADGLEHATVEVPLDYADPAAGRLTIALSRRRATDPARRRGVLLAVNGGPGGYFGLGRRFPDALAATPLAEVYDLIGFDPRGTGASTPLLALTAPRRVPVDSRPPDAVFADLAEEAREREDGNQRGGGAARAHFSTRNVARDMDVVRAALGEDTVNYLGYTYGTYVGAVFGTMFPERLDRSVLDSCVHPDWTWREQGMAQGVAHRENVEVWAAWTAGRDRHFGLGTSPAAVLEAVEETAARVGALPDGARLRTLLDSALGWRAADRSRWEQLGLLVGELRAADGPAAEKALAGERLWPPEETGEVRGGVLDAVILEKDWPSDIETYFADVRLFRDRYPYGCGVTRAQPLPGAFRAFTAPEPPVELVRDGYPAGLVVHADGDPVDHYPGGAALAERLGHRLVTVVDCGGHEIYAFARNPGVDAVVEAYLIDGVLPASDPRCPSTVPRPQIPADDSSRSTSRPDSRSGSDSGSGSGSGSGSRPYSDSDSDSGSERRLV
ncbi:alpha/beta fold hydrolase [Streptomyces sp. NPDC093252]|uniref:alpha/beta fold hydrolase n=1 Tax=Streptomyces sp. NPDC093252 TaxID=3154980 RepID=UPI00343AEC6A